MEKVRIEHFGVMILLKAQLVPWKEKITSKSYVAFIKEHRTN